MPEQSKENRIILLDLLFGIRAWGLIVYGALPANLALLGIVNLKIGDIDSLLPYILPATILPVWVTFILVRNRQKEWYLTIDHLNFRSIALTLFIILVSALISGAAGVIDGKYIVEEGLPYRQVLLRAITESFLMGVGSLVLSSTLFMTIITRGADLPGLPDSDFVKLMENARRKLKQLSSSSIWHAYKPLDEVRLVNLINSLQEELKALMTTPGHRIAAMSIVPVKNSVDQLGRVLGEINDAEGDTLKRLKWSIYFEQEANLSPSLKVEREFVNPILIDLQKLRSLKLGE